MIISPLTDDPLIIIGKGIPLIIIGKGIKVCVIGVDGPARKRQVPIPQ